MRVGWRFSFVLMLWLMATSVVYGQSEPAEIRLDLDFPSFGYAHEGFVEDLVYGTDNVLMDRQISSPLLFSEPLDSPPSAEPLPDVADETLQDETTTTTTDTEKKASKKKEKTAETVQAKKSKAPAIGLGGGVGFTMTSRTYIIGIPLIYRPNFGKWWRRLSLVLTLPVVYKTKKISVTVGDERVSKKGSKWGFGDLSFGLNYLFRWRNLFILPGYTIKFPTGDKDAQDNGLSLPMGSGSFDHIVTLTVGLRWRLWRLLWNNAYRYNGDTEDFQGASIEQGGNFFSSVGPEFDPLLKDWWIGASLAYFFVDESRRNGVSQPTDIHMLNALLYTYYAFADNFRFEVSGGYPFWTKFNADLTDHPDTGSWFVNAGFKFNI